MSTGGCFSPFNSNSDCWRAANWSSIPIFPPPLSLNPSPVIPSPLTTLEAASVLTTSISQSVTRRGQKPRIVAIIYPARMRVCQRISVVSVSVSEG
mmetsp:Transcript_17511/g.43678  ORF Transcript_17511/g.43678 Transcript_17511/m.43678 type:complete len:96 (+) Transcript_17511:1259-1546(+)